MNIFNWSWWKKSKENKQTIPINTLVFTLDEKHQPYIQVKIENLTEEAAVAYADLLASVTIGLYNKSILDTLMDVGSKDITIYKFVEQTLLQWQLLSTVDKKTKKNWYNKPQVKPTSFNKLAK